MSCNCMDKFEEEVVKRQPFKDLIVIRAEFDKAFIFNYEENNLTTKPILEIELTCEGRKHPVRKDVIYNYCPFCGKPFKSLEKEGEEVKP